MCRNVLATLKEREEMHDNECSDKKDQGHVKHEDQNKQGRWRGRGRSEGLRFVDTNHMSSMSVVCGCGF